MSTTRADVADFLACNRIAMVGVSRNQRDFSRSLFQEFCKRGYDMVPVNPHASEIEGRRSFARLQDVNPPAEGALLMTSPTETDIIVHDCLEAGISRVWMYRASGQGAVSAWATDFCHKNNIRLVEGHCPFMFLPGTNAFHRIHGFLLKISGRYPTSHAA